ncbi:MAG TPA: TetR/AcrR family transcriptional regulator [Candidatus Binatia bacterium]|nr:TetR/AcrR family transcriptional regulator [Candidatus Binatia bacterium]
MARVAHPETSRGRRRKPKVRRNAILRAALVEFAQEGLAGARMDAIADAAGVNKALLYYYFRDKDALYGAVLDRFFQKLAGRIIMVCDRPGPAGERFLSYVRAHFDSIAESPYYARIFMSELMSAGREASPHLDRIFAAYLQPIAGRVLALVQEGIGSRDFRPVDPNQFLPSAIGSIVHYFLTAPLRQKFMPQYYASHEQVIPERRAAVLDFIAAALFRDRDAGIRLAARIAAQPMLPGDAVAQPGSRKQRTVTSRTSEPTLDRAQAPMRAGKPDATSPPPGGYQWMNRWFPDVATARTILDEERKRYRRPGRPKAPNTAQEGGPK